MCNKEESLSFYLSVGRVRKSILLEGGRLNHARCRLELRFHAFSDNPVDVHHLLLRKSLGYRQRDSSSTSDGDPSIDAEETEDLANHVSGDLEAHPYHRNCVIRTYWVKDPRRRRRGGVYRLKKGLRCAL